jgi:transposase InsO family protein
VRFRFILAEKAEHSVSLLCRAMAVSRSGFYAWLKRKPSPRAVDGEQLTKEIRTIHQDVRERYGSPRMHRELIARGYAVGRHRVAHLMKKANVRGRQRPSFIRTTDSNHALPVAPNLLQRNFVAPRPNHSWVGDITYIPTREGWLYLAVVIDLYSRFVVGWAVSRRIDVELVLSALSMAMARRSPPQGLIMHSDRGSQYASGDYQRVLQRHGMKCSMSRVGDCWDNAVAESFFGILKAELVNGTTFLTHSEAKGAIAEYIEIFYNRRRRHSTLDYVAPAAYERMRMVA